MIVQARAGGEEEGWKAIVKPWGECLPGTVPKDWCSNPSVLCCGFEVGPRGPTVMNHLKDFVMLRSLDWELTRDRHCPFFFFFNLIFTLPFNEGRICCLYHEGE